MKLHRSISSLDDVRMITVSETRIALFIQCYQWKEAFGPNAAKTGNVYYTYDSGSVFSKNISYIKRKI